MPTAAYDDEARHGHFAVAAPKAASSSLPLASPLASPLAASSAPSEPAGKDVKSIAARFPDDAHDTDGSGPRLRASRVSKGKGKEAAATERETKKPLRLLDLPVDILKDIVKEVTHTNDLASLALCHSALHRLTTPHIYSRFDIVWPDSNTHAEPRSGVDALTYGLATLVMAEDVFGEAPNQRHHAADSRLAPVGNGRAAGTHARRRRGNRYAHFTRKFSLGNGPADWVQEYLITKEGGKMLGTLVALAVARMRSLETFIWDMPTGVLRDVWIALSSLGDRDDGDLCRLDKVWVRWHNNSSADDHTPMPPPPPPPISIPGAPPPPPQTPSSLATPPHMHPAALDRVEHPSFSILPPLKSLSVLDIDELAYLDEMAVLVGKSLDKLRELRVGIARHALTKDWVTIWEGDSLQQVDPRHPTSGSLTIGERRLGGVLGILTGFVNDMREPTLAVPGRTRQTRDIGTSSPPAEAPVADDSAPVTGRHAAETTGITSLRDVMMSQLPGREPESALSDPRAASPIDRASLTRDAPLPETVNDETPPVSGARPDPPLAELPAVTPEARAVELSQTEHAPRLDKVLRLDSLELERVPISVPVLQKGIDWTRLTALTLLNCPNHEQMWKTLRRSFAPTPKSPTYPHPRRHPACCPKKSGKSVSGEGELEYRLRLKKVHTNTVSPALISFLKETLAPNSLQVLFLQEARTHSSSVAIDAIFRGPLRRHRSSLKKILIDSSDKGPDGMPNSTSRWRKWTLTRDVLSFVCSGKMPALRELGMAIDYRDWHFFLQHLPSIPQLRSLYLPILADHVHGASVDPRELALQIVDVVALRPEVELCYMGIANKCFEILENKRDEGRSSESALGMHHSAVVDAAIGGSDDDDDDEDDAAADDDDDDDGDGDMEVSDGDHAEDEESESEADDVDDTDSELSACDARDTARLRLREILFYDDKVAIFKARHGRL